MSKKIQESGTLLERAFRDVLQNFLEGAGFIIDLNRIQCTGTQFGCDLRVEVRHNWEELHPIRIFFECKNYGSTIKFAQFIEKPFQIGARKESIDLWVLVSPKRSIANDADLCFQDIQEKFPFPIVLLTPDEDAKSFFALYEESYRKIYSESPPADLNRQKVIEHWTSWFKEQLSVPRHLQRLTHLFEVVDPEAVAKRHHLDKETYIRRAYAFYRGKMPDWDDVASDLDVHRKSILGDLENFVKGAVPGISFAIILSEAGAGKSTVLHRIALELAKKQYRVLFTHKLPFNLNPLDLFGELKRILNRCGDRPLVIVIDNASSSINTIYDMCAHLQEKKQTITVIVADRAARWRTALELGRERFPRDIPVKRQLMQVITQLTSCEVSDLIAKLKEIQISRRIVEMDAQALHDEFLKRYRGDLLVTLHEIIEGQNFDEIIRGEEREFRKQWPDHNLAYALTASLHQFGLESPCSLIARLSKGTSSLDAEASFARLLAEAEEDRLLLPSKFADRIATRHEVVARSLFSGLPQGEQRIFLERILENVDTTKEEEVTTVATLLVSPELRKELWSLPFIGELYNTALNRLPPHPKLFHTALLYSRQRGDIATARRVFESTPSEYRTPALIQDLAMAERKKAHFLVARELYRSGLDFGKEIDEKDFSQLSLTLAQGLIDLKLLTEYALFEHQMNPSSDYPVNLLFTAVQEGFADAHLYHCYGGILGHQGHTNKALDIYSEAEKHFPSSGPFFRLAKADLQSTPEGRLGILKTAIEEKMADAAIYTEYALFLKRRKELEEARKVFGDALRVYPTNAPLYQAYALMEKEQGNVPGARELFERGLKADPTHAHLYQAYALMEKEQGNVPGARELFERGLKADPTHAHLYLAYGDMEATLGYWRQALIILRHGIDAVRGKNAPLYQVLGRKLALLLRFDEAEEAFRKGLDIDPVHAPIFQEQAFSRIRKGDKKGAEEVLENACQVRPTDCLLHATFAQVLYDKSDPKAERLAKRALELCKDKDTDERKRIEEKLRTPVRWGKTDFVIVDVDQKGTIENVQYPSERWWVRGFLMSAKGERLYFKSIRGKLSEFKFGDIVLYDLTEFPLRVTNRFQAINVEPLT